MDGRPAEGCAERGGGEVERRLYRTLRERRAPVRRYRKGGHLARCADRKGDGSGKLDRVVHERATRAGAAWFPSSSRHSRRSEEHTSELQSLMRSSYAVFCLKKKN